MGGGCRSYFVHVPYVEISISNDVFYVCYLLQRPLVVLFAIRYSLFAIRLRRI
jgi:hypothetical protein